jgi:hypothetical protein
MRDRRDREARIVERVARLAALAQQWSPCGRGVELADEWLARFAVNDNVTVASRNAVGCVDEEIER